MSKVLKSVVVAVVGVLTILGLMILGTGSAQAGNDKHRICHATGNGRYVVLDISANALLKSGHGDHANDIIPPLLAEDGTVLMEKNWDEAGRSLFEKDCKRGDLPDVGAKEDIGLLAMAGGALFIGGGWLMRRTRRV